MSSRADYAPTREAAPTSGGLVALVESGGPADRAGIVPGTVITHAEGVPLRDVIDWRWHSDGPEVSVQGRNPDGAPFETAIEREPEEAWGIEFADPLFDPIRTCSNRCAFCFLSQLPKGLRRALYVRDDDFRLSFLQGNFVTLTNLTGSDVDRIIEQHLSPLYVSLHAVSPEVRARLVCANDDRALERFDTLVEAGIDLHVQIVLVPDGNDGEELERTLRWLAVREGVLSVGVVPLGYTSHQQTFTKSFEEPAAAAAVIDELELWREAFRARAGVSWVHAADEFYLNARRPIPPAEQYDGFPQYENGIGLVRSLTDDIGERPQDLHDAVTGLRAAMSHATLVTGELMAPVFEALLAQNDADDVVGVLPVANRFFGGNVSVAGLLTATDIVEAIGSATSLGTFLVPDVIANVDGLTLDNVPVANLAALTGADVRLVSCNADGLLAGLTSAVVAPDTTLDP